MIRKILFVAIAVALLWEAAACSPGADSGSQKVVARAELEAIAVDNALSAAADLSAIANKGARQTISVSFFVGHIGPPPAPAAVLPVW